MTRMRPMRGDAWTVPPWTHHDEGEQATDGVGERQSWSSEGQATAGAQEQPGPDRATQGNHLDVAILQPLVITLVSRVDEMGASVPVRLWCIHHDLLSPVTSRTGAPVHLSRHYGESPGNEKSTSPLPTCWFCRRTAGPGMTVTVNHPHPEPSSASIVITRRRAHHFMPSHCPRSAPYLPRDSLDGMIPGGV